MKELRQQAISLLARREYSHAELRKKLAGKVEGCTAEEIEAVLADLSARGLLSDQRAAASYLRSHGARFGTARLRQILRARGIDEENIATSLGESGLSGELDRAGEVWKQKFGTVPRDQREWARQARFLQSRGFSVDVIRRLLKKPKGQALE